MRSAADNARTFQQGRYRLTTAGDSCVGNRYPANFDVLHIDAGLPLIAVADGMGGGRGSAVAGATAMATLVEGVHDGRRRRGSGASCGTRSPRPRRGSARPAPSWVS